MVFQPIEMGSPEPAIGSQPLVQVCERLGPDPVQAALRVHPRLHQPRIPEDSQVLRDPRLAEAKLADELTDRLLAIAKRLEDRYPVRLSKDLKCRKLLHHVKYAKHVIYLSSNLDAESKLSTRPEPTCASAETRIRAVVAFWPASVRYWLRRRIPLGYTGRRQVRPCRHAGRPTRAVTYSQPLGSYRCSVRRSDPGQGELP